MLASRRAVTGAVFATLFLASAPVQTTFAARTVTTTPQPTFSSDVLTKLTDILRVFDSLLTKQRMANIPEFVAASGNGSGNGRIDALSNVTIRNATIVDSTVSGSGSSAPSGTATFDAATSTIFSVGTLSLTTPLAAIFGGTGTSTPPSYGRLLVGNASGGYDLVSTSSLGISAGIWGSISGVLSNQSDLQGALDTKLSLSTWYATTTTALAEGSNHYYTDNRVAGVIAGTTTSALAEGSNLYFTAGRVQSYLDTIGKGYYFATSSADRWKTQSNFFATSSSDYWLSQKTTDALPQGASNRYYSPLLFAHDLAATTTSALAEGSNLYYTDNRVESKVASLLQAGSGITLGYDSNVHALTISSFGGGGGGADVNWTYLNGGLIRPATSSNAVLVGMTSTSSYARFQVTGGATFDAATSSSLAVTGTASSSNLVASNSFTLGTVSGFLKATAGVVASSLVDLASDVTGILGVANGGTGSTTLTGILKGNGTAAVQSAVAGVDYESPLTFDTPLSRAGNVISLSTAGDWSGTLGGYSAPQLIAGGFATTSADYWRSQNPFFSTTSAAYWETTQTTDNLAQGSTNRYYATSLFAADLAGTTTTALAEGSKLYFTNDRADARINATSTIGTLTSAPNLGTVATSLSGFLKATAGVLSTAAINLATDISGILGVTHGGTGWSNIASGALVFGNGSGALATTSAATGGQVLAYLNGVPTWTASTTFSAPLVWTNGNVAISAANGTTNGYLTSGDWTIFNNKVGSSSLSAAYPLSYSSATGQFSTAFSTTTTNTWSGLNTFTAGVSLGAATSSSFAITSLPWSLLSTDGNGRITSTSTPSAFAFVATSANATSSFAGGLTAANGSFNILQNGNVGIGTTTPQYSLSVQGSAQIYSGNLYTPTELQVLNSTSAQGIKAGSLWVSDGYSGTAPINGAYIKGNVGIGTTTPGSLLSVGNTNGINFSTATSTFSTTGGINLIAGCFAKGGQCLRLTDLVGVTLGNNYGEIVTDSSNNFLLSPSLPVAAFGAVGDASTDNASAYSSISTEASAVMAASGKDGVHVTFPCGRFKSTTPLSFTTTNGKNITISGGGHGCTTLYFSGSNGIDVTVANQQSSVQISDLNIVTNDTTGSYTGINIHRPTGAGNAARWSVVSTIEKVNLGHYDNLGSSAYWGTGINLSNVSYMTVKDWQYAGAGPGPLGVALNTVGDPADSQTTYIANVSNAAIDVCDKGIVYGDYVQGVNIDQSNITNCNYGVYAGSGLHNSLQLGVSRSQINAIIAGIHTLTAIPSMSISGNTFLVQAGAWALDLVSPINSTISDNNVSSQDPGNIGSGFNISSIGATNENVQLSGNSFSALDNGVVASAGVSGQMNGNTFRVVSHAITNASASFQQCGNQSDGASIPCQNMLLTGNLGIGTTSPEAGLSISNADSYGLLHLVNSAANGTASISFRSANDANGGVGEWLIGKNLGGLTSGQFSIWQGTAGNRVTIDASGNVGIGTTSPIYLLDVQSATGDARFKSTTATNPAYADFLNTANVRIGAEGSAGGSLFTGSLPYAAVFGNQQAYPAQFATNNNVRMTIASSGNVGIGTTTPLLRLVSQSGAEDQLGIANSAGKQWFTAVRESSGDFALVQYGVNERLRVTSSGNVGIGTTTPTAQFSTTGTVRFANFGAGTLQTDANGNLSVSSDERLKAIDSSFTRGLSDVLKLDPILYHWNATSGLDMSTQYAGFSAQNVRGAVPEAVGQDGHGFLTLQDRPIIGAVVNAEKEIGIIAGTFRANLTAWLGDASNGIGAIFARDGHFSDRLCIGSGTTETCVNQQQLAALLATANSSPLSASPSSTLALLPPATIQIHGNNPAVIAVGSNYTDLGATISGPQEDINLGIVTFLNGTRTDPFSFSLDTSTTSTSTVDYVVVDQFGTTATATRTVIVQ